MTLVERLRQVEENCEFMAWWEHAATIRAAISRIEAADKALELAVCRCHSGPDDCPAMIYRALVREQDKDGADAQE